MRRLSEHSRVIRLLLELAGSATEWNEMGQRSEQTLATQYESLKVVPPETAAEDVNVTKPVFPSKSLRFAADTKLSDERLQLFNTSKFEHHPGPALGQNRTHQDMCVFDRPLSSAPFTSIKAKAPLSEATDKLNRGDVFGLSQQGGVGCDTWFELPPLPELPEEVVHKKGVLQWTPRDIELLLQPNDELATIWPQIHITQKWVHAHEEQTAVAPKAVKKNRSTSAVGHIRKLPGCVEQWGGSWWYGGSALSGSSSDQLWHEACQLRCTEEAAKLCWEGQISEFSGTSVVGQPPSKFGSAYEKHFGSDVRRQSTVLQQSVLARGALNALTGVPSVLFSFDEDSVIFSLTQHRVRWEGCSAESTYSMLRDLGMDGTNFRRLELLAHKYENDASAGGLILQAFAGGISRFLQAYRACVLQIPCAVANRRESHRPAEQDSQEGTLTVLEVLLHTRGLSSQLRFMARLCDVDGPSNTSNTIDVSSRGVALLSRLHVVAEEGGVHAVLAFRLFAHSCQPYLSMLRRWVFTGIILDPYDEFGICSNPQHTEQQLSADYWTHAYSVRTGQAMPSFLSSELRQILDTGKVINLLKSCGLQDYGKFCELLPEVQLTLVETSEQLELVNAAFRDISKIQNEALNNLIQARRTAVQREQEREREVRAVHWTLSR